MSHAPNSDSDAMSPPRVANASVRYISCSQEEMVQVEIEAWASGADQAHSDGARALRELAAIEQRAELACEEALETYIPLDLARFHDVFTLAWIAGYWAACGSRNR